MKQCMLIDVYKQSGANPVSVAEGVMSRMGRVNDVIRSNPGNPGMTLIFDTAKYIRRNIDDVIETMIIGIILAVVVVYLFLGNVRSTIITGIAIPNSLLGAFVIMYAMGFTLNLMSLMALSLTVGLLVDDAIVVRENIFRKLESGLESDEAAVKGTTEVMLAVIATTLTIIAVFLPIGFLSGIIGRFFKQFGLSVVFAMAISLFDALTVAPLLSAYFAGTGHKAKNIVVTSFDRFQTRLERYYKSILTFSINRPLIVIGVTTLVLVLSLGAFKAVKKTFSPEAGEGEFLVNIDLPSGTSLDGTREVAMQIADRIKTIPELDYMTIQVGNANSEDNIGTLGVFMVPMDQRTRTSAQLQQQIREMLRDFAYANVSVDRYQRGAGGGGSNKPYILNIAGTDLNLLNDYARKVVERLKKIPDLTEITTSYREGKPEFQVHLDDQKMQALGVTHRTAGRELRYQVEGDVVGKLHDRGLEYDVRIKLRPDQRDIQSAFHSIRVPNIHNKMIPLSAVATSKTEIGPSKILRQDRARVIQVMANTAPGGAIGSALDQTRRILERDMPMPPGISYSFIGQADSFKDTVQNIMIAFFLSLIFIYLVILYESVIVQIVRGVPDITPFTIFMALPPALSGAFISLFITGNMLDIFSMIGMVMLLGLVTKNSILLVDFAIEGVRSGMTRREAIMHAGMVRLRPILMTTFAMIAGTLPMVIAGGEAGKYRVGMGVVIIGGLTVSTLITLIVVPAVFEYIDIFRESVESRFRIKKRSVAALALEAAPAATEVLPQPAAPAKKARRSR
jgi:HAE1 family hydrophobic/amphiphilic exporter-1